MSIEIMTLVFKKSKTRGAARLVLLSLADTSSDEGQCFPSVRTLAIKAGVGEQTAREYLHVFSNIGLIEVSQRFKNGHQTSNLYQIDKSKIGDDEITGLMLAEVRPPSHRVIPPLSQTDPPPSVSDRPTPSVSDRGEPSVNHQKEPSLPRERDLLFDAISTVCQIDPHTAGGPIGKAKSKLLEAQPPYTVSEVEAFGKLWWSWDKRTTAPGLNSLLEGIGRVRSKTKSPQPPRTGRPPTRIIP